MLRALVIVLAVAACGPPASGPTATADAELAYPVDPLPPEVVARMGPGPSAEDFEAVATLLESAEPEMVRLRRPMTPIIVKIDNLPEDGIVWTVLSFHGAMDENFTGPWFDGRWIARRVRKAWDGQTVIDWADSNRCDGLLNALSQVSGLRPPPIEPPDRDGAKNDGAKTSVVLDRQYTVWTTWAPSYDLRFGGGTNSEVGQWAIRLAVALQPCWTASEPNWR